jgi:hypothetical protein
MFKVVHIDRIRNLIEIMYYKSIDDYHFNDLFANLHRNWNKPAYYKVCRKTLSILETRFYKEGNRLANPFQSIANCSSVLKNKLPKQLFQYLQQALIGLYELEYFIKDVGTDREEDYVEQSFKN